MVIEAAEGVVQARRMLRVALERTPHDDPDFPALLKAVHDMGVVTASELAEWAGLSRGAMYDRMREVR